MISLYITWFICILVYTLPFTLQAQDSNYSLEHFQEEGGDFTVLDKVIKSNLSITIDTRVMGKVVGNITVRSGKRLVINGQVEGNITIGEAGRVIINGQVYGSITLQRGSLCQLNGQHTGQVINKGGQLVSSAEGKHNTSSSGPIPPAKWDIINKTITGDLTVHRHTQVNGDIAGKILVLPHRTLVLNGQLVGPITIAEGARAFINGQIVGDITIEYNGYCKVRDKHQGQLINRQGQFVGPPADSYSSDDQTEVESGDLIVIDNDYTGELVVKHDTRVNGHVRGKILVYPGIILVVKTKVIGSIELGEGARAVIKGAVVGDIKLAPGSHCKVRGKHTGQLYNEGGTFVGPKQ